MIWKKGERNAKGKNESLVQLKKALIKQSLSPITPRVVAIIPMKRSFSPKMPNIFPRNSRKLDELKPPSTTL